MAADEGRIESLTVYLAKQGLELPGDTIKDPDGLQSFEITDDAGVLGTLYVESRSDNPPRWGRFFVPQIDRSQLGRVSSTSAVLHAVIDGRVMLLTFGQGRYLLKPICWEDRFGLRVALNSIGASSVRSIDKHTLDTVGLHSRVQVSKGAPPSEFGLDIERDILRAITGTPVDHSFGDRLGGLDSLHVNARVTLQNLRTLLSRFLTQFAKETFKETFPWVDHISDVKDPTLTSQLDVLMLQAIAAGRADKCWLAIPEPIEWADIAGFRYRRGTKHPMRHDIHLVSFVEDSGQAAADMTVDYLQHHDVLAVDGEDTKRHAWPVYKCIYCEVEHSGDTFLLSAGRWYKVASDFVSEVNDYYRNVPRLETGLPEYNDASEEAYNERTATENAERYALMDRKIVAIGGGYSKVEFCDLLSRENDLIHVKRYGGSGVLSHLFLQGVVSGQLFASDAGFRESVNSLLPDSHKLSDVAARPDLNVYRVVFAIVSSEKGTDLTLPFFSRLSLRHAMQGLQGYGYKVALAKIRVPDDRSKTKTFTLRKPKR